MVNSLDNHRPFSLGIYRYIIILLFCSVFTTAKGAYQCAYLYDSADTVSLSTIRSTVFKDFDGTINNGFSNGTYWIKISIDDSVKQQYYLSLEHAHLTKAFLYSTDLMLIPELENKRYLTYHIQPSEKDVYYLKVHCPKEGFIPLKVYFLDEYLANLQKNYLGLGLYYGVAISIFILHLLYFFNFRRKTYLFYACMLVSLGATFGYRDGFFYYLLGDTWVTQHIEPLINISITISLALFSGAYLQHKRYIPGFRPYGLITLVLPFISYAIYLVHYDYSFFVLTEDLVILSLTVYYATSIVLYRKNSYSVFFAWAYGLILIMSYEYYNSGFWGYEFTGITLNGFRIGGILEIAVFTFAITYQAKMLQKENGKLYDDLENKNRELTTFTMQFVEKNAFIHSIGEELQSLKPDNSENGKILNRVHRSINQALSSEDSWDEFKTRFENVNHDFYNKLKKEFPELSNAEIKLAALLKLKLSIKESAALLNHSERSVVSARSRLRKKFGLEQGDNLYDFLDKY